MRKRLVELQAEVAELQRMIAAAEGEAKLPEPARIPNWIQVAPQDITGCGTTCVVTGGTLYVGHGIRLDMDTVECLAINGTNAAD